MKENYIMYEAPALVNIGKAQNLIQGIEVWGDDIDTQLVIFSQQFADDVDVSE
jgi:hypothetical protein